MGGRIRERERGVRESPEETKIAGDAGSLRAETSIHGILWSSASARIARLSLEYCYLIIEKQNYRIALAVLQYRIARNPQTLINCLTITPSFPAAAAVPAEAGIQARPPVGRHSAAVVVQFQSVVLQSSHASAGSGYTGAAVAAGSTDLRGAAVGTGEEPSRLCPA